MEVHVVLGGEVLAAFGCARRRASVAGRARRRTASWSARGTRIVARRPLLRNGSADAAGDACPAGQSRARGAHARGCRRGRCARLMTTEESLLSVWIAAMVGRGDVRGAAAGSVVCGIAVAVRALARSCGCARCRTSAATPCARASPTPCAHGRVLPGSLSLLQTFQQVASEARPATRLPARAAHQLEQGRRRARLEVLCRGSSVAELGVPSRCAGTQHQAGGSMKQVLDAARDTVQSEIELRRALRVTGRAEACRRAW